MSRRRYSSCTSFLKGQDILFYTTVCLLQVTWLFQTKQCFSPLSVYNSLAALSDTVEAWGHSVRQTLLQHFVFLMSCKCRAPRQVMCFSRWDDKVDRFFFFFFVPVDDSQSLHYIILKFHTLTEFDLLCWVCVRSCLKSQSSEWYLFWVIT